jgi:hypothetical protein
VNEKMTDEELDNLREIDRIGKLLYDARALRDVLAAIKGSAVESIEITNEGGVGYTKCPPITIAFPGGGSGDDDLPDVPLSERGFGV